MLQPHEIGVLGLDMNRRALLVMGGAATVGIAALGLAPTVAAAATKPRYGGSIKIGLHSDSQRLDPHPCYRECLSL